MDQWDRQVVARGLSEPRSRRQVFGQATKVVLGGVGAALTSHGLGTSVLGRGSALAATAPTTGCPPAGDVPIRCEISKLTAAQLASLRRGVAEMKRRSEVDPEDPTGWLVQANLHAVPGIPSTNTWCQHNSWFFFPWHRMYLYWFERILRDAAGDPKLGLPYWNYSDDPANRALPPALRDELDAVGMPNSLYEARRAPGINDGSTELSLEDVAFNLDSKDFFPPASGAASFGGNLQVGAAHNGTGAGTLEGSVHNNIHGAIGGSEGMRQLGLAAPGTINYHCSLHPGMTGTITVVNDPLLPSRRFVQIVDNAFFPASLTARVGAVVTWVNLGDVDHTITADDGSFDSGPVRPNGYMAIPLFSSRDPVFWLHHANIDRLWERWLALKDGRANPTGEVAWMDQEFSFYDIDGSEQTRAVGEFLDVKCLGYRYDDPDTEHTPDAPPGDATPVAIISAADATVLAESPPEAPVVIGPEPVTATVELAPPAEDLMAGIVDRAATPIAGGRAPSLSLVLDGIENLAAPNITFAVYVNLPPDSEPDPASDAFVGSLYLFATFMDHEHEMGDQGLTQTFDITRAVQASQARGDAPSEVMVTIVPVGAEPVIARLATPVAEPAEPFVSAAQGPWITIERITVVAVE